MKMSTRIIFLIVLALMPVVTALQAEDADEVRGLLDLPDPEAS